MAILTVDELIDYAPLVSFDYGTEAAIVMAEMLAYGPRGSGRTLERQTITEVRSLPAINEVRPSCSIDTDQPIKVEWRQALYDNNWQEIPADDLEVDRDRIRIKDSASFLHRSFQSIRGRGLATLSRPLIGKVKPQLRLTYDSGFDFTQDTPEIQRLKAALGGIITLQYIASRGINQMVTSTNSAASTTTGSSGMVIEKNVDGEAAVKYAAPRDLATTSTQLADMGSSEGGAAGTMSDFLSVFRQYRATQPIG